MNAALDFVALEWVKDEVGQTLNQAQHALQAVSDSPQEAENMKTCLTAIHQVHGTFLMVALKGPTEIAKEMESLAQAIFDNNVSEVMRAQETLMQAILQMPRYLESLHKQQRELPQLSLSIVNNLRKARGEDTIGGASPERVYDLQPFSEPASSSSMMIFDRQNGATNVPKLRHKYLQALVSLLKKDKPRGNLALMGKVFVMLERICGDAPMGHLSKLAAALIEGLGAGAIKLDKLSGNCLKQLDKPLKLLAQEGAHGLETPVTDELAKTILDLICNAGEQTPKMMAVKDKYIPSSEDADEDFSGLLGPDEETLGKVTGILMNELKGITDKLDLYNRGSPKDKSDLVSMVPLMDQISSTLSMVGLTEHQELVKKQILALKKLESSDDELVDDQLLDMAEAFLEIEAKLRVLAGDNEASSDLDAFGDLDVAQSVMVKETRVGLSICTNAIADLVASGWDRMKIDGLPELLVALRGSLGMMEQQRAGDVMLACARYIEKLYLEKDRNPDDEELDCFADAIASIDYFLERVLENTSDSQIGLIETAEESVKKLGFEVKEVLERESLREEKAQPSAEVDISDVFDGDDLLLEVKENQVDDISFDQIEIEDPGLEFNDGNAIITETSEEVESSEETVSIRNQIHEAAERIKRLSNKPKKVGDVVLLINDLVALISDIADQTDILSVDSDIKESISNESDAGFSLAANEVQRLAERSGIAARQLAVLVDLIQAGKRDTGGNLDSADSSESSDDLLSNHSI